MLRGTFQALDLQDKVNKSLIYCSESFNYVLTSIKYMIVLGLRTADQGRVTANSHALSASFHPDLRHFKLNTANSKKVVM